MPESTATSMSSSRVRTPRPAQACFECGETGHIKVGKSALIPHIMAIHLFVGLSFLPALLNLISPSSYIFELNSYQLTRKW